MNIIKISSKGEEVKMLQKYLGLTPDGNFGLIPIEKLENGKNSKDLHLMVLLDLNHGLLYFQMVLLHQQQFSKNQII